jgi:hypothetical protein
MTKKKLSEVTKAKEAFVQDYMKKEPYSEYVNMVGITKRYIAETEIRIKSVSFVEKLKDELEKSKEILRESGEDPEEWCITVGLRRKLPDYLTLPEVYKGFKVYVVAIGEIVVL